MQEFVQPLSRSFRDGAQPRFLFSVCCCVMFARVVVCGRHLEKPDMMRCFESLGFNINEAPVWHMHPVGFLGYIINRFSINPCQKPCWNVVDLFIFGSHFGGVVLRVFRRRPAAPANLKGGHFGRAQSHWAEYGPTFFSQSMYLSNALQRPS